MLKLVSAGKIAGKTVHQVRKQKFGIGRFISGKYDGSFTKSNFSTSVGGFNDFEFSNLVELQQKACSLYKDKSAFGTLKGDSFEWSTYEQLGRDVQKFRNVLLHLNFKFNDKVALISNNRVEWPVCAYATMSLGGQIVPMYEAQLEHDWRFIVEDSDAKVLVVATQTIFDKVKDYVGKVGKVEAVLLLDADDLNSPHSYQRWMNVVDSEAPSNALSDISPEHLCTIIYTSGTTGRPKGVELCHRNIQSGVYGEKRVAGQRLSELTSLAFLPWAHIFGMTAELHAMLSTGSRLAIVPHKDKILQCLVLAKPDLILSVPVLFNKVFDGVMKANAKAGGLQQKVFNFALSVARKRNHKLEFGEKVDPLLALQHKLVDKVVLSKVRAKLGGNLKFMVSGGAATSTPVLEFFEDIGIPVLEGYGLTETSPAVTASSLNWENRRLGTSGVPLEDVTVRIVDPHTLEELPFDTDGEVTVAGPNVMVGYRKNPAANAESFYTADEKRFFRTGDMGRMVEGKFLKITGRIKEQFKLENGKYVVPAPMEDVFCRSPFISQVFLYGMNRPHTVALIVPDYAELAVWVEANKDGEAKGLAELLPTKEQLADPQPVTNIELFRHEAFQQLINNELIRVGASLKLYEKPRVWTALLQPFTQENQQLTPKMSLRRNNILKIYQPLVDQLYAQHKELGKQTGGDNGSIQGCVGCEISYSQ